jgi:hypothetical protein
MPELASSLVRLEESGGPRAVSCQLCAATDRQAVPGPRCRGPQYTEYVSTRSYTRATGARTTVRPVDAARADLSAHRQQGHPIDGTRPGRGQPHPHGRDGMHGRGRMPFSFLHQQAIASPKPRWPTDLPPTEEQQRRQAANQHGTCMFAGGRRPCSAVLCSSPGPLSSDPPFPFFARRSSALGAQSIIHGFRSHVSGPPCTHTLEYSRMADGRPAAAGWL